MSRAEWSCQRGLTQGRQVKVQATEDVWPGEAQKKLEHARNAPIYKGLSTESRRTDRAPNYTDVSSKN